MHERTRQSRLHRRPIAAVLIALTTVVAIAICSSPAFGSPAFDVSGRWIETGPYSQTSTIAMNKATGRFTGSGFATNGTGYTWPNHGTVTGARIHWVYGPYNQLKTYTATCDGTVSAGGTKIVGTCTDTVRGRTSLPWSIKRNGKPRPRKTCQVPKLAGDTLATAKSALTRANSRLGKVTKHHSKTVRTARIISSRPTAGTKRPAGARVNIVVSG